MNQQETVVVGNRPCVKDRDYLQCPGCGEWMRGERGMRTHMNGRFVTIACRPFVDQAIVRRAYGPDGPVGWDVLINRGNDSFEWADRLPTKKQAQDNARQWNEEAK